MKAMLVTKYGAPDVLELRDVVKPTPKDNEILIRVHAAVAGPADCAFRKGEPFLVKLLYGFSKPKLAIQGVEFSGEVEATGKDVQSFKVGDQVFGMSPDHFGAYAEYLCVAEEKPVVAKPTYMTYEEAAGIVDGASTSLVFLRDVAKIKSGQSVLINGASGGIGAAAVQLAKYFGAQVTGVCSAANLEMVKSLGADQVIDYTKEDFTKSGRTYDVIFDAVGKSSFSRCKAALAPKGVYLTTFPTLGIFLSMLRSALGSGKKAKFTAAGLQQNKANLNLIKELCEAGKLRTVIDRCYPLEQAAEAHRYVEKGHKRGNVIITVNGSHEEY